ncbi:50S ribosomal protein L1, chloroplastic [Cinnamomum micranthum f. kanehirae]|uniref:Large ribosomal subunit protein uL1c n=1 Tax=Cinnamomum micranthum f. kanehirae TaxID=337451 RepID=A0A443PC30_9MAGN|nr:50S ribosomal protein L1, chloroplastic [Cinnamomum micranthum f. kanehirae]
MAASETFLSIARRFQGKPSHSQISLHLLPSRNRNLGLSNRWIPSFLLLHRSLCSSSSSSPSDPQPQAEAEAVDSARKASPSATIKPTSYAPRIADPPSSSDESPPTPPPPRQLRDTGGAVFRQPEAAAEQTAGVEPRAWTREDIRYVKDVPSISPVSYPSRVAPLPEDKVSVSEGKEDQQLERENRMIEADARLRRVLGTSEEEVIPFPTLVKADKKKQKVVLDLQEAIREVKANAKRNFVETVEAHVKLGVDPRRGDQMVRGATTLPHGTGKVVRVAVFAEGAAADEARAAGADIVGGEELIEEIKNGGGKFNFDKCISTPTFMPRLGKIARILGPRGMMPNPKLGSVTNNVAGAVKEAKCGRIDFKIDKTAIVHVGLGKVNFSEELLRENVGAFVNALLLAKPVGLKKTSKYAGYVNSFTLCSTMGPGFPVSIQSLSLAADHYNKLQQLK